MCAKRPREESEALISTALRQRGITVEKITEESSETADFKLTYADEVAFLEVKEKQPDPLEVKQRKSKLLSGEIVCRTTEILPKNTLAGIFEKAASQLSRTPEGLRLIWVNCRTPSPAATDRQIYDTLYGGQRFISRDFPEVRYCYWFQRSAFWHFRDQIDAVISSAINEHRLYRNPWSARRDGVQNSKILHKIGFSLDDGAFPPGTMTVDDDFISRPPSEKIDHLRIKYQLSSLEFFNLASIQATIFTPS